MSIQRLPHLVALLAVLLLGVGLWFGLSARPRQPSDTEAINPESTPAPEDPSLRGHEPSEPAADRSAAVIEVEVVDARGAPVEGALVRALGFQRRWHRFYWTGATDALHPGAAHAEASTNAHGLAILDGSSDEGWVITAHAAGYAPGEGWALPAQEGPQEVRIVLRAAHVLEGRVIDVNKQPVVGALVVTEPARVTGSVTMRFLPHAVSSDDGTYRLEGVNPGTVFLAVAPRGMTLRGVATVRVPEIARFDIVLPPLTILRGRVIHEETGNPVAGVTVVACVGNGHDHQRICAQAVTDEGGGYEIVGLPPVRLLEVEGVHDSLVQTLSSGDTHRRDVVLDEDRPVVWDLAMQPGAFIVGVVEGVAEPANLRVLLSRRGPGHRRTTWATTGPDGRFRSKPLLGGRYEAGVRSRRASGKPVSIDLEDGGSAAVTMQAEPRQAEERSYADPDKRTVTVRGRVGAEDGSAVPGAWVGARDKHEFFASQDRPFQWVPSMQAAADRDGVFQLTHDARSSAFEVVASGPGFAPSEPVVVLLVPDQDVYDVEVVLDRGHAIQVAVLDAATTRPIAGAAASLLVPAPYRAHVDFVEGPPPPAFHGVSDAGGGFLLEHVRPGTYRLDVGALGYVPARHSVTVPTASPVEIALQPALDLGGTVVFADGSNPGIVALTLEAVQGGVRRRTASRNDGTFVFRRLPAGTYTIALDRPLRSTLNILEETAGPFEADRRDLVVTAHRGLTIEGTVLGPDGEAVGHATLSADDEEGRSAGHLAWSKKDGTFELVGLPPGRVRLTVKANGYLTRSTNWIEPGARGVVVSLRRGGTIAGTVVDEAGRPVEGLYIAGVEPENDGYVDTDAPTAKTNAEGRFELTGILIPRVELAIPQNLEMRVLLDATSIQVGVRDLRVVCAKSATITGVVLDEDGVPFAGASVSASPPTYGSVYVATSDTKGRFTLVGLFPDREYDIEVEWTDPIEESENSIRGHGARGGDTDVEIRLE